MKRLLLITLLVLSHGPVYAEWAWVARNMHGMSAYADPDTIRRKGELVKMWQLIDFKWMQGDVGMGPHQFFSTKTHKQFDCAAKRLRLLALVPMAEQWVTHGRLERASIDEILPV